MASNKNKWDLEKMQQYCNENAIGYIVLEEKRINKGYQNQQWALIKCPNKNHEPYWVWWNNFLHNYRCKQCDYESKNKSYWTPQDTYDYILSNGYIMIDKNDFKNVDTPVICIDNEGYFYNISITNLKCLERNQQQSFHKFKSNPMAIQNIKNFCKIHRPDYDIVSTEYKGIKSKYTFIYNGIFPDNKLHNRLFETTADLFINGMVKHPELYKSRGELNVEKYLIENKINYIPQKRFDDCRDKKPLPFDFYLPKYNLIIEVMGLQHEKIVEYFGGEDGYIYRQEHDRRKREYAKQNNINLLEIWHYDIDNIESILMQKINEIKNNLKLESVETAISA